MMRALRELQWTFRPWHRADEAILRLLSAQGEMSGQAIGAWLCMSPVALYPALLRLEMIDVVSSHWEIMPYPRRRLYRIAHFPGV